MYIYIKHAALYLLRYQIGRMDYLIRTTPASMCEAALVQFDAGIRCSYQAIVARVLTESQWEHACLPTRDGGLGLRSVRGSADAAYYSSRAATWERCEAIYSGYASLMDDPVRQVESNVNSKLGEHHHIPALPSDAHIPSQQSISRWLSAALAQSLKDRADPFQRVCQIAHSAPMCGRWLAAPPSKTLDMHMSGAELTVTSSLHLGVDVLKGNELCKFCGEVLDAKGIHPVSCMSGGDVLLRHNRVRNIIFRYACRGQLNAELEKAGILNEEGVFVDLSRPADVMVDGLGSASRSVERLALDIKVINSLGVGHYADTLEGPLVAAGKYRDAASARDNVRAKCAEKGVRYEPLVFTAQGGCEKHAEAIISQIADNVAQAECRDKGKVKAEMLETISMSIARSVAKAVIRRQPKRPQAPSNSASSTFLFESAILEEPIEDD